MMILIIGIIVASFYLLYNSLNGNVSSVGDVAALISGNLTASQIAQYASNAGFTGSALIDATAIALAESSGNPSAYNPEIAAGNPPGLGSYGLWQINLNAHPEFAGLNLNDPQTNANCAYQIYSNRSSSFTDWSTFKSGAYAQYVAQVSCAVEA
jgi:Lysozyme like domain